MKNKKLFFLQIMLIFLTFLFNCNIVNARPWWWAGFSLGNGSNWSNSSFERWHSFFLRSASNSDSAFIASYTWGTGDVATINGINGSNNSGLNFLRVQSGRAANTVYLFGDDDATWSNATTLTGAGIVEQNDAPDAAISHNKEVFVKNKGWIISSANMNGGGWQSQNNNSILFFYNDMPSIMGKIENEFAEKAGGTFHDNTAYGTTYFYSPYGDTVEMRYAPDDNNNGTNAGDASIIGRMRTLVQNAKESVFYMIDGWSSSVGTDALANDLTSNDAITKAGCAGDPDASSDWDATILSNFQADHTCRRENGSFNRLHSKTMIIDYGNSCNRFA